MASKCQGTNINGEPCSARPVLADGYCYWHSPARAADRAENNRKGGQAKSNKARAKKNIPEGMTTADVAGYLGVVFRGVITGRVEPGVGTAAAAVARAMIAVTEAAAVEQMQAQIAELERRLPAKGWSA